MKNFKDWNWQLKQQVAMNYETVPDNDKDDHPF